MFSTLLASRPTAARATSGHVLSLALHGTILTVAIIAGMRQPPVYDAPRETRVVPLAPSARTVPPQTAAAPARPKPPVAPQLDAPTVPPLVTPTEVPITIPEPGVEPWVPASELPVGDPTPATGTPGSVGSPEPASTGTALGAADVQHPAALRANSPLPRYPDVLRTQRMEGRAIARFVVGTDGRVEPSTLTFVESTHPAFEASVRAALPRLRFTPGRVERRAVRQWVELPFGFKMQ